MPKTEGQIAYEAWRSSAATKQSAAARSAHPIMPLAAWEQLPEATRAKWETVEFRAALEGA